MRVAALYDIHGNLPALEAVLADIRRLDVDLVVFGGDVLPGPMPRECMDLMGGLDVPARCIRGNCDRIALEYVRGEGLAGLPERFVPMFTWCAGQLKDEHVEEMSGWPLTFTVDVAGVGRVLFCHATPHNDSDIFLPTTEEAKLVPIFEAVDADVVVCGHVHMQFDRQIGTKRVVNAGSVGSPYAPPGAYWVLLDEGIELKRTAFDADAAAKRIAATGFPGSEDAARDVISPPSEASMIEMFSPRAIGAG